MRNTFDGILDLVLWRDGGQRQARRNAWRAMVADHVRARQRAEAADALDVGAPVSSGYGARGEGRSIHG
jgi:hypothetical protein